MPRNGNGVYSAPAGTTAVTGTTIESTKYNAFVNDLVSDANGARPVTAGGTGSTSKQAAVDTFFDGTTEIEDTNLRIVDPDDATKVVVFDAGEITTATTRTVTIPDKDGTMAMTDDISGLNANGPRNLCIVASVASNALTIAIKGFDGNDPSATNPVYIPVRSATANSGDMDVLTLSAATSLVVSSGSTLGTANATAATLVVVGFNDGGTFRLGVINANGAVIADGIASSTAEGGAGGADSAGVFYTGTAVTSKAYTVLGYVTLTQATAGTWATAPSVVQTGPAPAAALAVLPFTKFFESAEQTITAGGLLTIAHGLSAKPQLVKVMLICKTAQLGYEVGDIIEVMQLGNFGGAGTGYGAPYKSDDVNIEVKIGLTASPFVVFNWTNGTGVTITNASWRLIVRAWA